MIIETERLNIRNHKISDLESMYKLYSDKKAMYYLPHLFTEKINTVRENLLNIIEEEKSKERNRYFYCIELKNEKKYIGEIGFTIICKNDNKAVDIGYFIFPEYWGKEYVTEAMKALIKFAFDKCNISKIIASFYRENIGSKK